jgi:hypothetical protein
MTERTPGQHKIQMSDDFNSPQELVTTAVLDEVVEAASHLVSLTEDEWPQAAEEMRGALEALKQDRRWGDA